MSSPVLAIHGSASAGSMWQALVRRLEGWRNVVAPDLSGYGCHGHILEQEPNRRFAALADYITSIPAPIDVVAHSFGGALAVHLANRFPNRVNSLTLYEPIVPPSQCSEGSSDMEVLRKVWTDGRRLGPLLAMEQFCDFWSGTGSWHKLSEGARDRMVSNYDALMLDFAQVFSGQFSVAIPAYSGSLKVLFGDRSPPIVAAMARRLLNMHPQMESVILKGLGHLGPITHADQVAKTIAGALAEPRKVAG